MHQPVGTIRGSDQQPGFWCRASSYELLYKSLQERYTCIYICTSTACLVGPEEDILFLPSLAKGTPSLCATRPELGGCSVSYLVRMIHRLMSHGRPFCQAWMFTGWGSETRTVIDCNKPYTGGPECNEANAMHNQTRRESAYSRAVQSAGMMPLV